MQAKSKSGPSTGSGRTGEIEGFIVSADRLDKALAEATELSRARIQALIAEGKVAIEGKIETSAKAKVSAGSAFRLTIPPAVEAEAQPQDIPLTIAYEDEHLIVIDKPAGMVVHPAAGNPDRTLVNALLYHCKGQLSGIGGVARPGIVHRIDKDTSGLLVVAKTDKAHEGLARQFKDHSIERRYLAICSGQPTPPEGTIATRIGRSDANRKKMAVLDKNSSRGKHAVTHYKVLDRLENCALIECRLETGRTHQVRVHCASIGHALLGDPLYGQTPAPLRKLLKDLNFTRQALHAAKLGFEHPLTREWIELSSELPKDMQELIDQTVRFNR
ncbi:RluA family pseudouridine synthase [Altererythrobacter sp. GH1-8]|uniref:RluA family pseudouridine synthase n=1 Tax=Altererythrobacter sp. GH1-8 TaxID=3349333 RepID=UPI00374CF1F9